MSTLRERISQYDLIYKSPARSWMDGFSSGNGSMCAISYDAERAYPEFLVNHHSLWDLRYTEFQRLPIEEIRKIADEKRCFREAMSKENPQEPRIVPVPVYGANLRLESGQRATMRAPHKTSRHLHLFDGILETKLDRHFSHPVHTSFVVPDEDILVVQVRNVSCLTAYNQRVRLFREHQQEYDSPEFYIEQDAAAFRQDIKTMKYTAAVLVVSRPDQPVAYADRFSRYIKSSPNPAPQKIGNTVRNPHSAEIAVVGNYDVFISISPTDSPEELIKKLRKTAAAGSDALKERNRKFWNDFWTVNEVKLGDPGLEQLWYLSNYHFGIAGKVNPAWGLCGPWFGKTCDLNQQLPWYGYFTNDYNAQSFVIPAPVINRPELAEGIFRMLYDQLPRARKNAEELFKMPGAYYPLCCGPDGNDVALGQFRLCMGSGPYWCSLIYRHYRYTENQDFLKKYGYEIIRDVCRFFAAYIEWNEPEQCYHLKYSQNPELLYIHLQDPIDTLAFLKETFRAGVACSELFLCDEDERKKWQHILDHFPEYPTNRGGFSPLTGLPENHINHSRTLAPVFPTGELDPEFPGGQLEDAKKEFFNPTWKGFMHSYSCNDGFTEGWTGKVYHRGIPACRLGEKDIAWKYLCDLISGCVKPNGLIAHNMALLVDTELSEKNAENVPEMIIEHDCGGDPISISEVACGRSEEEGTEDPECKEKMYPVLEGPAIYLLLVGEMLLQGYHGLIRLFPALPDHRDAAFRNLQAEGSLLVSAERKNGIVSFVKIKSLRPQSFQLLNPWKEGQTVYLNGNPIVLEHHHAFTVETGEEILLTCTPDFRETEDQPVKAEPHLIMVEKCRGAFVGKPELAEYYMGLEQIRTRRLN